MKIKSEPISIHNQPMFDNKGKFIHYELTIFYSDGKQKIKYFKKYKNKEKFIAETLGY